MSDKQSVRFSEQDLDLFSRASGDRNPLHLSKTYSSKTAYGQRVVFGALGCIASMRAVSRSAGAVKRVIADFHRPMFLDVDYRCEASSSENGLTIRLLDGSTPVLTTSLELDDRTRVDAAWPERSSFPREVPRELLWGNLSVGLESAGEYRTEPAALRSLYERWELEVDPFVTEVLLWSSYFVGMELPGQSALFFRAAIDLQPAAARENALHFEVRIENLNSALAQVRSNFALSDGQEVIASGKLIAFVRPEMPALRLPPGLLEAEELSGKVAFVVGASRGLGAALSMMLAASGAKVIAVSRSEASWLADLMPEVRERVAVWQGDAGSPDELQELSQKIERSYGRLDYLVCSAFPSIPSLRMEPTSAGRIQEYIQRATSLVLNPLCHLLPQLDRSGGCLVLISSAAVESPVRDWPHYVAAKAAAEAFCRIAPMQFSRTSSLIVRPPRLLTEMTNTPMGRKGAESPMDFAWKIGDGLRRPPAAGSCRVFQVDQSEPPSSSDRASLYELRPSLSGKV